MAQLKRAENWEISDSDAESEPHVLSSTSGSGSKHGADAEERLQTAGCRAEMPLRSEAVRCAAVPASPAKRRRRTREQVEADRQRARHAREAREQRRLERAQEKEEKRREQLRRREAAERVKSYRPETCLRSFTVCVDPVLVQNEESDLLIGILWSMEWKCAVEEQHLTHSITWRRTLPEGEDALVVQEEQVLMVLSLNEFLDMLISVQKAQQGETLEEELQESLFKELSQYLNTNAEKVVTLAVIGLSSWEFWRQQQGAKALTSKSATRNMDMEEALVFLQLDKNVSVIFLEGWQDLADHVCAVTKALSKRPFKQLTEVPDLPFCVEGSWASGTQVGKNGSGLCQVWRKQIQQLNRVSSSVAAAVSTAFPSPQMLLQAYEELDSEADRKGLLANLPVRSGETERRVGPEISTRLYRFLTSHNPQLVLD
ncbi:putative crossover junction endonuclease EME2 [Arapaima gigas]